MDRNERRACAVMRALAAAVLLSAAIPTIAVGQDAAAQQAYFRAVADYFEVPAAEVAILADWSLPPDEIPVALFLARRTGISPEALVALRNSGRGWVELASRYEVGAAQLHVPLQRPPSSGLLSSAYQQYGSRPVDDWNRIGLTDEDIVTLVNVRVLSSALGMRPDEVLERRSAVRSFVELYAGAIG